MISRLLLFLLFYPFVCRLHLTKKFIQLCQSYTFLRINFFLLSLKTLDKINAKVKFERVL
ncbi:hypothetical protein BOQ07_05015 [Klebsiella michiganensis]|uniref:Uncharacterized protein n=1 Tax=Klebsiella michiganensis TaxID=1134687 RepID=A0A7H4MZG1_9ENTR|nr:hypothetical protein [Klebsiella michiganensis]OFU86237.1 hypothetical protein HMPREF3111_11165 [Proteus sp. HMSC10D02]OLU30119.1 hypothetical protein BOQ07_05015 [Klebsiella michiganensis]OSY94213.1 hypothetical protein BM280_09650 [Klebsiella michiganensis]STV71625.1 Uncharacterised protein [Klebsiella michiganensis]